VATRSVSAIAAEVTPRSAARAKSGRTMSSGRTRLALRGDGADAGNAAQLALHLRACAAARAVVAGQHQHVLLGAGRRSRPSRAHPAARQRLAQLRLDACLEAPALAAGVMLMVSVALRTSARTAGAKGSAPVLPPPTAV
jgi:hypothetical protein